MNYVHIVQCLRMITGNHSTIIKSKRVQNKEYKLKNKLKPIRKTAKTPTK